MTLKIVTFYWYDAKAKHHGTYEFGPTHVNKLAKAFKKHLKTEHEFVCITDNPQGIDPTLVKIIPLWHDFRDLGRCFTRLKVYSEEMKEILGDEFVMIDLDVCLVGDVTDIIEKMRQNSFTGYRDSKNPTCYSGAFYYMKTGSKNQVYHTFKRLHGMISSLVPQPEHRYEFFKSMYNKFSKFVGSDQSWQTEVLGEGLPKIDYNDGVWDYWMIQNLDILPANARIVFVNGMTRDVSLPSFQEKHKWLKENWTDL